MEIEVKPTGKIIQGSILDVNKKSFKKALYKFDPLLYIRWNARKNDGWGKWELRRLPIEKTPILKQVHNGIKYYELEYVENDMVHHVLDLDSLNYRLFDHLRQIDTWNVKDWATDLDQKRDAYIASESKKNRDELRYQLKSNRRLVKAVQEDFLSTGNAIKHFIGKY